MDKERFKQQVIDIMREGEVFKPGNSQASEKEYSDALERRALRICREAEVPTLHKAVTTAAELKTWIQERGDGTTFLNMQPLVLGDHITQVAMQQPWIQMAFESDRAANCWQSLWRS